MDFSKFTTDDFEVKDWINEAFKSQKEGTSDQYAATLVMKLQMFIQEVNNVIEDSCQQAVNSLPRVVRELEAVKQEAIMLQEQMRAVKHDIEQVEQNTSQSMQNLQALDNIKSRMRAAASALQEADNWTSLSADVDQVFESGDVEAMADKLVRMQQSLHMLTDVPDYAERCQLLESLKNRLEAVVSPVAVAAFSQLQTDKAQMLARVFSSIERSQQLHKFYYKCQKTALIEFWKSVRLEKSDESLAQQLTQLYDQLLSVFHSQYSWCAQIFADPCALVCELLSLSLDNLDPGLPGCLAAEMDNTEDPLTCLGRLMQTTHSFAKSLQGALVSVGAPHTLAVEKLAHSVYAPHIPFVRQYAEFEANSFSTTLESIPLDHSELGEGITLLRESVGKLFHAAKQASNRCCETTFGCGYVGLLQAIQTYLASYEKEFSRVLINLREKSHLDQVNLESDSCESDSWQLFQNALELIETCGQLLLHTDELDQEISSSILLTVGHYCAPHSPVKGDSKAMGEVFEDYKSLLISDRSERHALVSLYSQLEEGESGCVLADVPSHMKRVNQAVLQFAFDIVFTPLMAHLKQVSTLDTWTSESAGGALTSELPAFSLAPQEYMTKIGQYLLTLPQQLEPFSLDNTALLTALRQGRLPFMPETDELPEHIAFLWLDAVSRGTMHHFTEQVLLVTELSPHAAKQLMADLEYLVNVLDDLGLQPTETLTQIKDLISTPEEKYQEVSDDMPRRLASAVAHMRGINLR